jgi:hypothetical protein
LEIKGDPLLTIWAFNLLSTEVFGSTTIGTIEQGSLYDTAKSNYGFVDKGEFRTTAQKLIKDAGEIDAKLADIISNPSQIKVIDSTDVGFEGQYHTITKEISMTTSYLDGNTVTGMIHEISHSFGGEHLDGGCFNNRDEVKNRSADTRYKPWPTDVKSLLLQQTDRQSLYNNVYTLDFTLSGKRY